MGYGVLDGIAAAITTGRVVFTIAGDGDFLINGQELATAVQHCAKANIVLLNNGMSGTIRMHQERAYPQRESGSRLANPHFAALARAYGYAGIRITRAAELLAALAQSGHADRADAGARGHHHARHTVIDHARRTASFAINTIAACAYKYCAAGLFIFKSG